MKKVPLKDRFQYWFDNRMSNGSLGLIKVLAWATIAFVLVISLLIQIFRLNGGNGYLASFWDSMITVINAWMPSFEDGSIGYLILMAIAALVGLLLTSILIGIISSAIEEKVNNLKRGNSLVLEKDHIVILGFTPGEYTLLNQLVLAAGDDDCCILVAGDLERDTMEQDIKDNVTVPKNVRILCRTINIFDPVSLQKCSLQTSRSIIISPTDDKRTIKSLLAVSTIINAESGSGTRVGAILSKREYTFPASVARKHNVVTMQTNDTLAKIIAHTCTQPGLSKTFTEIFNFEGNEFYAITLPQAAGLTFRQLSNRLSEAVPLGIIRNGISFLNPDPETVIDGADEIVVFEESKDRAVLGDENAVGQIEIKPCESGESSGNVVIIGSNDEIDTLLTELPGNVTEVILAGFHEKHAAKLEAVKLARPNVSIKQIDLPANNVEKLLALARKADHVVVLCDHDVNGDDADMNGIFLLLNLREFRQNHSLKYNITVEMRNAANHKLVAVDDNTDYIVASDMSSLFLAQLSESPEIYGVYRELLSNLGNEIYLKPADSCSCCGSHSTAELREILLRQRCIFLGYLTQENMRSHFNPGVTERITLEKDDKVIVISEN